MKEHGPAPVSTINTAASARSQRKAAGVDAEAKESNLKRLRRIEGQVRGLQKMVEEDRYCADIMIQISAVQEALRTVGRSLMRNHLRHCATRAIKASPETAEAMYDELVDLPPQQNLWGDSGSGSRPKL